MTARNTVMPPKRGATARRHRMRCSRCETRFTLRRHPSEYVRAIRCPVRSCRSLNVYSCEASRRREMQRQTTCRCHLFPFPHRAGSLALCVQSNVQEPNADQWAAYQRILATPRSAFC